MVREVGCVLLVVEVFVGSNFVGFGQIVSLEETGELILGDVAITVVGFDDQLEDLLIPGAEEMFLGDSFAKDTRDEHILLVAVEHVAQDGVFEFG